MTLPLFASRFGFSCRVFVFNSFPWRDIRDWKASLDSFWHPSTDIKDKRRCGSQPSFEAFFFFLQQNKKKDPIPFTFVCLSAFLRNSLPLTFQLSWKSNFLCLWRSFLCFFLLWLPECLASHYLKAFIQYFISHALLLSTTLFFGTANVCRCLCLLLLMVLHKIWLHIPFRVRFHHHFLYISSGNYSVFLTQFVFLSAALSSIVISIITRFCRHRFFSSHRVYSSTFFITLFTSIGRA